MYLTARGAFEQVEVNLENAARTLGASEWRVFWSVTLPLAWPGVVAGAILAFARALGEFGATLMLAGDIPGRTATIPVAIYFAVEAGDMNQALFLVLITLAISFGSLAALAYWKGLAIKLGGVSQRRTLPQSMDGELYQELPTAAGSRHRQ